MKLWLWFEIFYDDDVAIKVFEFKQNLTFLLYITSNLICYLLLVYRIEIDNFSNIFSVMFIFC